MRQVRDITTREDWSAEYGMTIPVLAFLRGGEERQVRASAVRSARLTRLLIGPPIKVCRLLDRLPGRITTPWCAACMCLHRRRRRCGMRVPRVFPKWRLQPREGLRVLGFQAPKSGWWACAVQIPRAPPRISADRLEKHIAAALGEA